MLVYCAFVVAGGERGEGDVDFVDAEAIGFCASDFEDADLAGLGFEAFEVGIDVRDGCGGEGLQALDDGVFEGAGVGEVGGVGLG